MSKQNRRLKNLLIYPAFQLRMIFFVFVVSTIAPICLFFLQYLQFKKVYDLGISKHIADTNPYYIFLLKFQNDFYDVLLFSLVVSLFVSIFLGLIVTHRVAGPLVKMISFFKKVAEKPEFDGKITFRENDFFKELGEAYNERFKGRE